MGKYILILVFFLIIASTAYNHSITKLNTSSYARNIEAFHINHARNLSMSAMQALLPKIFDADDTEFNVAMNETASFPNNGSYYQWEELKGRYRYEISNQDDSLLVVTSTGFIGGNSYAVTVHIHIGPTRFKPDFPLAVYVEETIELNANARITGHVGTFSTAESAVVIQGNAVIDSSLFIGPGGDPGNVVNKPGHRSLEQVVKGGVKNLNHPPNYPMPDFPDFPEPGSDQGDIILGGGPPVTIVLEPEDFNNLYFGKITIGNNQSLTFNLGDTDRVIRLSELNIAGGNLILTGDGSISFYIENNFSVGGNSRFNQHGDADRSIIYYKGSDPVVIPAASKLRSSLFIKNADLTISGSGSVSTQTGHIITGGKNVTISSSGSVESPVIYAPRAHVTLSGTGSATCSIVAKSFEAGGSSRVYYPDLTAANFPDLDDPDIIKYTVKSWH